MALDTKNQKGSRPAASKKGKQTASNYISLDATTPLPLDFNSQIFTTTKGKEYVPFLNPKDNFGQLLIEACTLSPTTLSCVSSKAQYCLGNGWYIKDIEEKAVDKKLVDWTKAVNRKQESFNEIIKSAFSGLFKTGNSFIEVVRGTIAGTKFVRLYRRSLLDCRLSLPDDDDICNSVYYSKYFRNKGFNTLKESETVEIPIYSPNMFDNPWVKDNKGFEHTIIHLKNDMDGYEYYGMPSNVGSIPEQMLEYKHARYNMDGFDNNLVIGGVIVVKGNMTNEEAKKVGKDLIFTHSGDGKRGRWVILSSETGLGDGIDINEFTKQTDGSFIESDKHNEEKIYVSNQWNKLLIGGTEQKSIGQGNSAYIRSVFDIANTTVIIPEQQRLIAKVIKPIFQIHDDWTGTKWSSYDVGLKTVQPVSFLGDINVNSIITVDEGRDIIGKEQLGGEKGAAIIAPAKTDNNNSKKPPTNVPD